MTDSSTEMQTEGQERKGQREEQPQRDPAANHFKDAESSRPTLEEQLTHGSPTDKKGIVTGGIPSESDNGPPVKMQNLLHQVRSQIRSQVGLTSAKTSMFELMQQIKDRKVEMASLNGLPDGDGGGGAGIEAKDVGGTLTNGDHGKMEPDAIEPLLPPSFEEELEATKKTLKDEFEQQISQLRVEMRAYADQAVKDMESKMKSATITHGQAKGRSREQTEGRGVADKKQKPMATAAAPSLTSRRSRVLTRTMTTIIPKTCAPVIIGPRAKSETLSGCSNSGSLLMKESDFRVFHSQVSSSSSSSSRHPPNRRALPPVHPRQKPVWTMAHTGS
ncbi:unnamed protein product [Merluccius merluccius]